MPFGLIQIYNRMGQGLTGDVWRPLQLIEHGACADWKVERVAGKIGPLILRFWKFCLMAATRIK